MAHLCWENAEYSAVFTKIVCNGITANDHDNLKQFFRGASILMGIQDEQQVCYSPHPLCLRLLHATQYEKRIVPISALPCTETCHVHIAP